MKNPAEIEDTEEKWDRTPILVLRRKLEEDYVWKQLSAGISRAAVAQSMGWSRKRLRLILARLKRAGRLQGLPAAPLSGGCTFSPKVTKITHAISVPERVPDKRAKLQPADIPRLVDLYNRGYGLKKLAKEFGITARAVKKRLRSLKAYQGVFKEGRPGHHSVLLNASQWQTLGEATVQNDGEGLRVCLSNGEAEVRYTVAQVGRRRIRIRMQIVPLSAPLISLCFGLRSGRQEAEVLAVVQRIPYPVPLWTVAAECQDTVTLFLRGVPGKPRTEFYLPSLWLEHSP
jgi:hypothetical protein